MKRKENKLDILLLDDNIHDLDITSEILNVLPSVSDLKMFKSSEAALAFLQDSTNEEAIPSLIFLDINMPKIDGFDVLKELKSSKSLSSIPVVIYSSSDAEKDVRKAYSLGASCYVVKPVELASVRNTLSSIVDFWTRIAQI